LGADVDSATSEDAGEILAERVVKFMRDLQIPNGLTAVGYSPDDIPALVEATLPQHRVTKLSPIPAGEAELTKLFRDSMKIW
jgi:hydroxyacid-oxoacid transhydrogenase